MKKQTFTNKKKYLRPSLVSSSLKPVSFFNSRADGAEAYLLLAATAI